jgi:hypothetical protein
VALFVELSSKISQVVDQRKGENQHLVLHRHRSVGPFACTVCTVRASCEFHSCWYPPGPHVTLHHIPEAVGELVMMMPQKAVVAT